MLTKMTCEAQGATTTDPTAVIVIEDSSKQVYLRNAIYVEYGTLSGMNLNYVSKVNLSGGLYLTPDDELIWWIT